MMSLAKVVLPAAEGPITITHSPGKTAKLTPLKIGTGLLGAPATTPSTVKTPLGAGNDMDVDLSGKRLSKYSKR